MLVMPYRLLLAVLLAVGLVLAPQVASAQNHHVRQPQSPVDLLQEDDDDEDEDDDEDDEGGEGFSDDDEEGDDEEGEDDDEDQGRMSLLAAVAAGFAGLATPGFFIARAIWRRRRYESDDDYRH